MNYLMCLIYIINELLKNQIKKINLIMRKIILRVFRESQTYPPKYSHHIVYTVSYDFFFIFLCTFDLFPVWNEFQRIIAILVLLIYFHDFLLTIIFLLLHWFLGCCCVCFYFEFCIYASYCRYLVIKPVRTTKEISLLCSWDFLLSLTMEFLNLQIWAELWRWTAARVSSDSTKRRNIIRKLGWIWSWR